MGILPACMDVHHMDVCMQCPQRAEDGRRYSRADVWVLGAEPRPSGRAAGASEHWAISAVLMLCLSPFLPSQQSHSFTALTSPRFTPTVSHKCLQVLVYPPAVAVRKHGAGGIPKPWMIICFAVLETGKSTDKALPPAWHLVQKGRHNAGRQAC